MIKNTLMIQGTTSSAGKSTLVAGLCRWLALQGFSVAPFKPQNMSLNSVVTPDGNEISRAQYLQALAAKIPPHVLMNPILLKPNQEMGCQVIVQGRSIGSFSAQTYQQNKPKLMPLVLESFHDLRQKYQNILVEGAGSPAEINLREHDLANMGFAEAIDCPVILVVDIDRGGAFAHLVGTLALLSPSEQNRIIGFVINQFRGERKLLDSGLDWLEQRTKIPVLGVIPYLDNFHLAAEDSLNPPPSITSSPETVLQVGILQLPHLSNPTDFDGLCQHPQVLVHWMKPEQKKRSVDCIIIPGSKNVRHDLQILKNHDWDSYLRRHLRYYGKLLGICGGLQMLGNSIHDPLGLEGSSGQSDGLGFFAYQTTLQPQKILRSTTGTLASTGATLTGYEIHQGITPIQNQKPFSYYADGTPEGVCSDDDLIRATYHHGLFDHPDAQRDLLHWMGIPHPQISNPNGQQEEQLNRLAAVLDETLQWPLLLNYFTHPTGTS